MPRKKSKPRVKTKTKPVPEDGMEPTTAWWKREPWIKRRTAWLWRLKPFLTEKNAEQCQICQQNGRCNRIPLDEKITAKIATGKGCPDFRSVWKKIMGKDDEYDWGF